MISVDAETARLWYNADGTAYLRQVCSWKEVKHSMMVLLHVEKVNIKLRYVTGWLFVFFQPVQF